MTDKEQKEIFAKNLNNLLDTYQKSQREVALAIQVSPQTFNTWCQAIAIPRMGKVQKLADYFRVPKSRLIDSPSPLQERSVLADSAANPQRVLSSDEESLLDGFGKLNRTGQKEALKRVQELAEIPRYAKEEDSDSAARAG